MLGVNMLLLNGCPIDVNTLACPIFNFIGASVKNIPELRLQEVLPRSKQSY